jgi:uncharacterized membrane protein
MAKYLAYIAFTIWAIAASFLFDTQLNDWSWPLICGGVLMMVIALCEFDAEDKRNRR